MFVVFVVDLIIDPPGSCSSTRAPYGLSGSASKASQSAQLQRLAVKATKDPTDQQW